MLSRQSNGLEFLAHVATRLFPPRAVKRLPNPLRQGHVSRTRYPLNFPVLRILKDYLQSFSHMMSLVDS